MLLVGQAPSRGSDPARPLSGRSGTVLASLAEMDEITFWRRVDAINLIDAWPGKAGPKGDRFNRAAARAAAETYMRAFALTGATWRTTVLCGRNVARAYGMEFLDWFSCYGVPAYAVIPHPSGVNHLWNDPRTAERARAFFRERLPRPEIGFPR